MLTRISLLPKMDGEDHLMISEINNLISRANDFDTWSHAFKRHQFFKRRDEVMGDLNSVADLRRLKYALKKFVDESRRWRKRRDEIIRFRNKFNAHRNQDTDQEKNILIRFSDLELSISQKAAFYSHLQLLEMYIFNSISKNMNMTNRCMLLQKHLEVKNILASKSVVITFSIIRFLNNLDTTTGHHPYDFLTKTGVSEECFGIKDDFITPLMESEPDLSSCDYTYIARYEYLNKDKSPLYHFLRILMEYPLAKHSGVFKRFNDSLGKLAVNLEYRIDNTAAQFYCAGAVISLDEMVAIIKMCHYMIKVDKLIEDIKCCKAEDMMVFISGDKNKYCLQSLESANTIIDEFDSTLGHEFRSHIDSANKKISYFIRNSIEVIMRRKETIGNNFPLLDLVKKINFELYIKLKNSYQNMMVMRMQLLDDESKALIDDFGIDINALLKQPNICQIEPVVNLGQIYPMSEYTVSIMKQLHQYFMSPSIFMAGNEYLIDIVLFIYAKCGKLLPQLSFLMTEKKLLKYRSGIQLFSALKIHPEVFDRELSHFIDLYIGEIKQGNFDVIDIFKPIIMNLEQKILEILDNSFYEREESEELVCRLSTLMIKHYGKLHECLNAYIKSQQYDCGILNTENLSMQSLKIIKKFIDWVRRVIKKLNQALEVLWFRKKSPSLNDNSTKILMGRDTVPQIVCIKDEVYYQKSILKKIVIHKYRYLKDREVLIRRLIEAIENHHYGFVETNIESVKTLIAMPRCHPLRDSVFNSIVLLLDSDKEIFDYSRDALEAIKSLLIQKRSKIKSNLRAFEIIKNNIKCKVLNEELHRRKIGAIKKRQRNSVFNDMMKNKCGSDLILSSQVIDILAKANAATEIFLHLGVLSHEEITPEMMYKPQMMIFLKGLYQYWSFSVKGCLIDVEKQLRLEYLSGVVDRLPVCDKTLQLKRVCKNRMNRYVAENLQRDLEGIVDGRHDNAADLTLYFVDLFEAGLIDSYTIESLRLLCVYIINNFNDGSQLYYAIKALISVLDGTVTIEERTIIENYERYNLGLQCHKSISNSLVKSDAVEQESYKYN